MPNRHGTATVTQPGPCEIRIRRVFAASAARVFDAWTKPELVRRWWTDAARQMIVCDIDLRVGGGWRYVTRDQRGIELGWHGVYRVIERPTLLVATEVFEGLPAGEALNTMSFAEAAGATTIEITVVHTSRENRDAHVGSGMEPGLQGALDRLEDVVEGAAVVAIADRYRNVAAGFTALAATAPASAWDNPSPCAGWVARDIVGHMVEWMPDMLRSCGGVDVADGPSVDVDPLGAWLALSDSIQAALDDPSSATREFAHDMIGRMPLEQAVGMIFMGDVFVHTWDLARATGLDETLDPREVALMVSGMEPHDANLRASGQYGPRVAVPDNADPQTRLIAFMGRHP